MKIKKILMTFVSLCMMLSLITLNDVRAAATPSFTHENGQWVIEMANESIVRIRSNDTWGSINVDRIQQGDENISFANGVLTIKDEYFTVLPNNTYTLEVNGEMSESFDVTDSYNVEMVEEYDDVVFTYNSAEEASLAYDTLDCVYVHVNGDEAKVDKKWYSLDGNVIRVSKTDVFNSDEVKEILKVNDTASPSDLNVTEEYEKIETYEIGDMHSVNSLAYWSFVKDFNFALVNSAVTEGTAITLPQGYYKAGMYEVGAHYENSTEYYLYSKFELTQNQVAMLMDGELEIAINGRFELGNSDIQVSYNTNNFESPSIDMNGKYEHKDGKWYIDITDASELFFVGNIYENTSGSISIKELNNAKVDGLRLIGNVLVIDDTYLNTNLPSGEYKFELRYSGGEHVFSDDFAVKSLIDFNVKEDTDRVTFIYSNAKAYKKAVETLSNIYVNAHKNIKDDVIFKDIMLDFNENNISYNSSENSYTIIKRGLLDGVKFEWDFVSIRDYHNVDAVTQYWNYSWKEDNSYFDVYDVPRFNYDDTDKVWKVHAYPNENIVFSSENTTGTVYTQDVVNDPIPSKLEYNFENRELTISKEYLNTILPSGTYKMKVDNEESNPFELDGKPLEITNAKDAVEFKFGNAESYEESVSTFANVYLNVLKSNNVWKDTYYNRKTTEYAEYVTFDDNKFTYSISKDILDLIEPYEMVSIHDDHGYFGDARTNVVLVYRSYADEYTVDTTDRKGPKPTKPKLETYELNEDISIIIPFDEALSDKKLSCKLDVDVECSAVNNGYSVTIYFKTPEIPHDVIKLTELTVHDMSGNETTIDGMVIAKTINPASEKEVGESIGNTKEVGVAADKNTKFKDDQGNVVSGETVIVKVKEKSSKTTRKEQELISSTSGQALAQSYDITLFAGDVAVEPAEGAMVKAFIPYIEGYEDAIYEVHHKVEGVYEQIEVTQTEYGIEFETPSFSTFVVLANETETSEPEQPDVEEPTEPTRPSRPSGSGSSGSTYKPSVVETNGVSISGNFSKGKATVGAVNTEDVAYKTAKNSVKVNEEVIKELTLTVSNYSGSVDVTFDVDAKYNGKTVRVIRAIGSNVYETTAVVTDGKVTIKADNLAAKNTVLIVCDGEEIVTELDLSAYTDGQLPVYDNSRVTSIKSTANGFVLNGYAFINGVNCDKKNSLWREIIFVNEEDTVAEKAYRMQVTSVYNTFLNSNKTVNPNGTNNYAYANYTVEINPNAIKDYKSNANFQKMNSGNYRVYVRVSDGKHSKLFPLKDIILSDGSTLALPNGFEVIDPVTRELRYSVK